MVWADATPDAKARGGSIKSELAATTACGNWADRERGEGNSVGV
jgi:hypothetical protein